MLARMVASIIGAVLAEQARNEAEEATGGTVIYSCRTSRPSENSEKRPVDAIRF